MTARRGQLYHFMVPLVEPPWEQYTQEVLAVVSFVFIQWREAWSICAMAGHIARTSQKVIGRNFPQHAQATRLSHISLSDAQWHVDRDETQIWVLFLDVGNHRKFMMCNLRLRSCSGYEGQNGDKYNYNLSSKLDFTLVSQFLPKLTNL